MGSNQNYQQMITQPPLGPSKPSHSSWKDCYHRIYEVFYISKSSSVLELPTPWWIPFAKFKSCEIRCSKMKYCHTWRKLKRKALFGGPSFGVVPVERSNNFPKQHLTCSTDILGILLKNCFSRYLHYSSPHHSSVGVQLIRIFCWPHWGFQESPTINLLRGHG